MKDKLKFVHKKKERRTENGLAQRPSVRLARFILRKQKWIEGSHYWGDAVRTIEDMLPGLMEKKIEQWLQQFFM